MQRILENISAPHFQQSKYLRELESASIVRSEVRDKTRLYYAGEFRLEISPKRLMEIFEEQNVLDLYKAKFGNEGMRRFRQITDKVKAGQMTYRAGSLNSRSNLL